MAYERTWLAVPPQLLTSDGSSLGIVTMADTRGFKVKAIAVLAAVGLPDLRVSINRVLSETQIRVGRVGKPIGDILDVSSYTVSAGAYIYAAEQEKAKLTLEDREYALYDQEPTVAKRSVLVDQLGRYYEQANPLPVQLSGGSIFIENVHNNLSVFITHKDNYPVAGDIHDSVRIGDGITEAGVTLSNELKVFDASVKTVLDSIDSKLTNDYGPSAKALRTAAQIGNATGSANFGSGTSTTQTLRVSANITRNGTELSYGDGTSDVNTLRISSNLKRQGNDLDYNFGTSSANTLRVSALLGNAIGPADFNIGANSNQTLRVSANLARNGNELSYNVGNPDANTLRTASVLSGANPDGQYVAKQVSGGESTNSTSTLLAANAVFRGQWFRWSSNYVKLISTLAADTHGTLLIDFSEATSPANGVDTDVDASITVAYNPVIASISRRMTPVQSKWVRHRYINGNATQTAFTLNAVFLTNDSGIPTQPLSTLPGPNTLGGLVRSVPAVPNPDGTGYVEVPVAANGSPKSYVTHIEDDILFKPLNSAAASQTSVGTEPTRLDPSPLANRRVIGVTNEGPVRIAIGHSPAITFDTGSIRVPVGGTRTFSIDTTVPLFAISENIGGLQAVLNRSASSATGTATNPSNALASDNIYAVISANDQNIVTSGYSAGTSNPLVSVRMGVQGNKNPGSTNTVIFQESQTGSAGNVTIITTSAALTSVNGHLYLAAISRRNATTNVTAVTGLGLTWTQITSVPNGNNGVLDVWFAIGTPTGNSLVSATFNAAATNSHIAVSRYSNVNPIVPIQNFSSGTGNSNAPTVSPALTGTNMGISYMAVFGGQRTMTAGTGYTLISSELTSAAGNSDSLSTEYKPLTASGSETPTGTLVGGNANWIAIGLAITPSDAVDPTVRLSYTLSAVPGATTGEATFSLGTNTTSYVDITPDRMWATSTISNLNVIVTGQSISNAAANIDFIFLELTDTTGNTSRVSIWQGARPVT